MSDQKKEYKLRPAWRSQWKSILLLMFLPYAYLSVQNSEVVINYLLQIDYDIKTILAPYPNAHPMIQQTYHWINYIVPAWMSYLFLVILYRRYSRRYQIMPYGVEIKIGLIQRNQTRLEYTHTRGVNLSQTIFERIVGFGDIHVATSGVDTELLITGIIKPSFYTDIIKERLIGHPTN
jgi:hypothetical protein